MSNLIGFSLKIIVTMGLSTITAIFLWSCFSGDGVVDIETAKTVTAPKPDIEATVEARLDFIATLPKPESDVLIQEIEVPIEVIKEVEVPVEVEKIVEVIKEVEVSVEVEKIVEVIKEVEVIVVATPTPTANDNLDTSFPLDVLGVTKNSGSAIVEVSTGGTGFFVNPEGLIVTNAHVVSTITDEMEATMCYEAELGNQYSVKNAALGEMDAKLVAIYPCQDIAILQINSDETVVFEYPYLSFADSSQLFPGEWLISIGYPYLGESTENDFGLKPTINTGVFSTTRLTDGRQFIHTEIGTNAGNSGGPLLNSLGEVVGVTARRDYYTSAIIDPIPRLIGVNYAVPSNLVVNLIAAYQTNQVSFLYSENIISTEWTAYLDLSSRYLVALPTSWSYSTDPQYYDRADDTLERFTISLDSGDATGNGYISLTVTDSSYEIVNGESFVGNTSEEAVAALKEFRSAGAAGFSVVSEYQKSLTGDISGILYEYLISGGIFCDRHGYEWASVYLVDNWKLYLNILADNCQNNSKYNLRDMEAFISSFIWLKNFKTEPIDRFSLERKIVSENYGWEIQFPINWTVVKLEETNRKFEETVLVTDHRIYDQVGSTTVAIRRLNEVSEETLSDWAIQRKAAYELVYQPISIDGPKLLTDTRFHTVFVNDQSYVEMLHVDLNNERYEVIATTKGPDQQEAGVFGTFVLSNGDEQLRQLVNILLSSFKPSQVLGNQEVIEIGGFRGVMIDPFILDSPAEQKTVRPFELTLLKQGSTLTGTISMTNSNDEKQQAGLIGKVNGDYIEFSAEFDGVMLNNSELPMRKMTFSGILANNQLIKGRYSVEPQTQSNVWMASRFTEKESLGNADD